MEESLPVINKEFIKSNRNSLTALIKELTGYMTTKSQQIIIKLKKLKEKAYFQEDTSDLEDFEWYLVIINFFKDYFCFE